MKHQLPPLEEDARADVAAARILRALLVAIERNLPGTLADEDPEFLHDLRVAVRRSRALLRELKRVFDPEPLAHFRDELKHVQAITGPTRDLDVHLQDFEERADLEPLRRLLQRRRAVARETMERELRSERITTLLADWSRHLDAIESGEAGLPDVPPVGEVAAARIERVYRRMVKEGRAIDDSSPHEALHDLRKQGKELRYLLEFFASLYPKQRVKPTVASLKALQDTLGRFQDREVQADLLRSLRSEFEDETTLAALESLVATLERQQNEARTEFAERFEAFAALGPLSR